jgi:hypothetical protein
MPRRRDDPKELSRRQGEWLAAIRQYYERTGTAGTMLELASLVGCTDQQSARYMCDVLTAKGHLVKIQPPVGLRRYVPVDRPGGAPGRSITTEQVIEWLRQADDQTFSLLRTEIEAEVIRRGRRNTISQGP